MYAMFHEVAFPFSWRPATHALLGGVTRVMARLIAGAAERVFVTIPAWGDLLERIAPQAQRAEWLPVPSTLDANPHPDAVAAVKAQFAPAGDSLVGHFGTYGTPIAALLIPAIAELLRLSPGAGVLFIGRGSLEFRDRFIGHHPDFAVRAIGTGVTKVHGQKDRSQRDRRSTDEPKTDQSSGRHQDQPWGSVGSGDGSTATPCTRTSRALRRGSINA